MAQVNMSALHLISGIINIPRFHREITTCPKELTEQCVHLLTNLGQNRDFAIKSNYEMMEFLNRSILPFDDAGYMRVSRHFVKELLSVVGPQHKMWGAISFVMLSTAQSIRHEDDQYLVWHRLNARFFEVLLDSGVISQEDERRLKAKSNSSLSQQIEPTPLTDEKMAIVSDVEETHSSVNQSTSETPDPQRVIVKERSTPPKVTNEINSEHTEATVTSDTISTTSSPLQTDVTTQPNKSIDETAPQIIGRSVKAQVRNAFSQDSNKS